MVLILNALKEKSKARGITPRPDSLDNPEILRRCKAGWTSLKLEITDIPEFEICFEKSLEFYRNLPWEAKVDQ